MNEIYKSLTKIEKMHFSSCEGCETPCCDGKRFYFIPLILEDFIEVYKNFAIVFAQINDEWRMLMLLSKDEKGCCYFVDSKCSIYDERPPGCHLYPLTPFYDDVLVDTSCPAINEKSEGEFFDSQQGINSNFYHHRLENFNEKREKSNSYLQDIVADMQSIGEVNGIEVFKYSGSREDTFISMHKESLALF